eukprot:Hpha_TRINITY_DN16334_c0_g4::TRINITY_DN16334_c0_g4_i1::g.57876::m.57876
MEVEPLVTADEPVTRRSCLVLGAFMLHSACNAFQWMDYTSVSDTAKWALADGSAPDDGIKSGPFNWLYSGGIIAAAVAMLFSIRFMDSFHFGVLAVGAVLNVGGAWLRYLSLIVDSGNYNYALASSILVGIDCGILYSYFAALADRWFPERHRTMVVSLGAQSNYFGWCLGSVAVPSLVQTADDLKSLLLWQAIIVSASLLVFFICHRERPTAPDFVAVVEAGNSPETGVQVGVRATKDSSGLTLGRQRSVVRSVKSNMSHSSAASRASRDPEIAKLQDPIKELCAILRHRAFMAQAICCGLLQGAGIAVPGVQDEIFSDIGYSSEDSRWTDFAFIATGVVGGLLLGAFAPEDKRKHGAILKTMFVLTTLSAVGLVLLTNDSLGGKLSRDGRYGIYLILMPVFGFGSIAFIGLALPLCCALVHPVSESVSGGFVELLGQAFAALLAQVVVKFWVVGGAVIVASVTYCIVFTSPYEHDEDEGGVEEVAYAPRFED